MIAVDSKTFSEAGVSLELVASGSSALAFSMGTTIEGVTSLSAVIFNSFSLEGLASSYDVVGL